MGRSASHSSKTAPTRSIVDLLGRLGGDIVAFLEAKLGLWRLELTGEIRSRVRQVAVIGTGAVLALIALALGGVAAAFALSIAIRAWVPSNDGRHALAFLIVAVVFVAVGAVLIVGGWKRATRSGEDHHLIHGSEAGPHAAPELAPSTPALDHGVRVRGDREDS